MLPDVVDDLADEERGVILLTGTTGSGKSTTLAAMINRINSTQAKHIVTIEDPIEYMHRDNRSIINQREVGDDTNSFGRALRRVLRQDPDVILVGEMRDEETVRTVLSAAETGHLVLSTVHTVDAAETVNRIIDFFSEAEQRQARAMLAGTLKGVISQRLVPTPDGNGRVATCEVLRMTGRVKDMILNPDETGKLPEVIKEGAYYGMQTFDQALLGHVQKGLVDMDTAMRYATHPHDFKLLVSSDGQRSTSHRQRAWRAQPTPTAASASGGGRPRADAPGSSRGSGWLTAARTAGPIRVKRALRPSGLRMPAMRAAQRRPGCGSPAPTPRPRRPRRRPRPGSGRPRRTSPPGSRAARPRTTRSGSGPPPASGGPGAGRAARGSRTTCAAARRAGRWPTSPILHPAPGADHPRGARRAPAAPRSPRAARAAAALTSVTVEAAEVALEQLDRPLEVEGGRAGVEVGVAEAERAGATRARGSSGTWTW